MVQEVRRPAQRVVLVNVESSVWPDEYKIWPHLGLLYVGTVAEEEGYEVVLWDELIQGEVPLEELVHPGDVVGLSCVITGLKRSVKLARRAKTLGAYVIAGNDAAMFRARQLLRLPGRPVDAVFTSNSIPAIRSFFRLMPAGRGRVRIPNVATSPMRESVTNESRHVAREAKRFGPDDFFLVPNLGLFSPEYWEKVWSLYRSQFGHKHANPEQVRNALVLLAQGCGRAGAGDICEYCTIRHVANVVIPERSYLERTLETYAAFGINTFFNVTDSAFEMGPLLQSLKMAGTVDSMVMYGRAQAIAQRPEKLDEWLSVVKSRLLINCGIDSADERVLHHGIHKSASKTGSRVEENRQAIRTIKAAGDKAHLHYSLIFGSPGETKDSCLRNLEFADWSIGVLGPQLDVLESDIYWLNFGAPCSVIFRSYDEARLRAQSIGKDLDKREWHQNFARYANELVVPQSCEENWYHFFTHISYEDALEYNARVRKMMEHVDGRIPGREFGFQTPST